MVLPKQPRDKLTTAFNVLPVVVLVVGLGLISLPKAEIHDYCDAATVTITATGEVLECHFTISATPGGSVDVTLDNEKTVIGPGETEIVSDIPAGTVVALAAEPQEGYWFVNWTGDVETIDDVDAATTQITIKGDYSVTANFQEGPPPHPQPIQYDLAVNSTDGGLVSTPGEGTFTYDEGAVVDLETTPDTGYRFVRWAGDVDTIADPDSASTTITMNGDYTITANFEEIPPRLANWPLIGGIIAAAVVAGLLIFFVRRRKAAETKRD
jgi:hypothetical protein